jgi:NADPH:quinone reductase-like Zn-dependent oxidoreductase
MAPVNKAVQIEKYSKEFSGLQIAELPVAEPGNGEVLVHLHLRPVNPADGFTVLGVYPGFQPPSLPAVPGLEGVAKVVKNGQGASKFREGQRVVGTPWPAKEGKGTWQEYLSVPEEKLVAVPDDVSDEAAAQFWVNPLTAFGFLDVLQVPKGEYLLQSAAGSTLGRELIQLCKHKGVKTINVVRRAAQKEELRALGADHIICSSDEDVTEAVHNITDGKGAYGAVDAVAGDMTGTLLSSVRNGGSVLVYGAMAGMTFSASVPDVLFKLKSVKGFWLGPWVQTKSKDEQHKLFAEVFTLLGNGTITPNSGKAYPLEEAVSVLRESQQEARGGKLFLKS